MVEQSEGHIIPPALENRPELLPELQYPFGIFTELRGSRRPTFDGPGQIPFSEFYAYSQVHDFTKEETKELWSLVHRIDLIDLDIRRTVSEEISKRNKG